MNDVSVDFIKFVIGDVTTIMMSYCWLLCIDWITGVMTALISKSPKTEHGGLSSKIGLNGLLRKGGGLILIIVAHQLALMTGSEILTDMVVIALICTEITSILENLGILGVPLPAVVVHALEQLKKVSQEEDKENK